MDMKRFFLYFITIAALTLAGCGGGGGGTSLMVGGERATQDAIDALAASLAAAEGERDTAQTTASDLQTQLDTANMSAMDLQGQLDTANMSAMDLQGQLDTANMSAMDLQGQLDTANMDVMDLQARINAAPTQEAADSLQMMLNTANADVTRLTGERNTANADVTRLTGERDTANADVTRLTGERDTANADVTRLTGERDTANMAISDVLGMLNLPPGATDTEISDAIAALSEEDPALEAIRTAVRTALGTEALDDLGAAVAKLANAYSTSEVMRTEVEEAMRSVMAKGFLQTMAGIEDASTSTSTTAPVPTDTNTEAENTSDGLEVSFVEDAGVSAFSPFPAGDGPTVPALTGFKHTVLRADSAGTEAGTHFQVVAFYSDAEGLGSKSLIVDEGEESTAKSFDVTNAMDFDTNGMADGAPAAPAPGATTTTRVGTLVTPTTGDARLEFDGSWRGVDGTFICTGGTCSGDSATNAANGLLLTSMTDADDMRMLSATIDSGQMWVFAPTNSAATVMVHDEDYLYLGWWHERPTDDEPGTAADPSNHGFSAFAGGSEPFDMTNFVMLEGDATYTGKATGKFAQQRGNLLNPTFHAEAFTANASLTAKFLMDAEAGTIEGSIHSFRGGTGNEMAGWKVTLMPVTLQDSDNNFTGAVDTSAVGQISGTDSTEGDWSGALFGSGGRTDKEPNAVAGTFKAEWGATPNEHTALSGAFAATHD